MLNVACRVRAGLGFGFGLGLGLGFGFGLGLRSGSGPGVELGLGLEEVFVFRICVGVRHAQVVQGWYAREALPLCTQAPNNELFRAYSPP